MKTLLTVVFDLDDTLYPEQDYVLSGFVAAGDFANSALGLPDFAAICRRLYFSGVRGSIFDAALAELGRTAEPEIIAELLLAYRRHQPILRLHEDAETALAALARERPLGLITDGPAAVQRRKIAALGLNERLDCLICTDELGGRDYWKPHSRAFEVLENSLPAERFVYVADNPAKDFVAPNARGWHSVRVLRPAGEYRSAATAEGGTPGAQIDNLAALPDLLATMLLARPVGRSQKS